MKGNRALFICGSFLSRGGTQWAGVSPGGIVALSGSISPPRDCYPPPPSFGGKLISALPEESWINSQDAHKIRELKRVTPTIYSSLCWYYCHSNSEGSIFFLFNNYFTIYCKSIGGTHQALFFCFFLFDAHDSVVCPLS